MTTIRNSPPDESERAVEIWRRAVDGTHHFLIPEDRKAIDAMVCDFLPKVPLWFAVDASDYPLAFMFESALLHKSPARVR